tara:strand:- start:15030 stop:16181 length:1152 start_codon:yes stop_codon:yes gene_type:complete
MHPRKILLIFGTRPEAIKMAPLFYSLRDESDFNAEICVTAQHREMLDQVLNIFEIKPKWDLDLMEDNQDSVTLTSKIFNKLSKVLDHYNPDMVLVHGDTITTFAAASVCFLKNIQICHIEAGLRTGNILSPYPEEFNRRVTSIVASWHFAPTYESKSNLIKEGVSEERIFVTGNTVIDSLYMTLKNMKANKAKKKNVIEALDAQLRFSWQSEKFVLITGHRRENFGRGLKEICEAILYLAESNKNIHFVYPAHFNPNVLQPVKAVLSNTCNIHIINPQEYESFLCLLDSCYLVLTDSGGIQEEAPSLGKPVILMRDNTERPEALESGTVMLAGANKDKIIDSVSSVISDKKIYKKMSLAHNPYGDGSACEKIVRQLKKIMNEK